MSKNHEKKLNICRTPCPTNVRGRYYKIQSPTLPLSSSFLYGKFFSYFGFFTQKLILFSPVTHEFLLKTSENILYEGLLTKKR